MKYSPIASTLFVKNRLKFSNQLKPNYIAFFNSNDVYPVSADSPLPFAQHRDIFYLSGIDQEESVLFLFPDCNDERHREILFLRETNEHIAVWEGAKLTKEAATKLSGIETIYWLDDLPKILEKLMEECANVYLNTNEHSRAKVLTETR